MRRGNALRAEGMMDDSVTVSHKPRCEHRAAIRRNLREKQTAEIPVASVNPPSSREELILAYREDARRLALYLMKQWNSRMDLDEINSIVDLSLCEAAASFRNDRNTQFSTYFFYYLKGNLVRSIASNTRQAKSFVVTDVTDDVPGNPNLLPLSHLETFFLPNHLRGAEELMSLRQLEEAFREACTRLNHLERETVKRFYLRDQKEHEIANELGYSRGHIAHTKHRAVQKLKHSLLPYW